MRRLSYGRMVLMAISVGVVSLVVRFVMILGGVDVGEDGVVVVDSSRLHLDNTEFVVSNEIAFVITVQDNDRHPTETIYLDEYTDDVVVLVGDTKIVIKQESISMFGSDGSEAATIPALRPILFRIWQDRMSVEGSRTPESLTLELLFDKTKVTCFSSAPFKANVIGNWYYW